jgi:hypothetical protein
MSFVVQTQVNRLLATSILAFGGLLASPAVGAPPRAPSPPAGAAPATVRPCKQGSPEAQRALDQLTALSKKISALRPGASPEPIAAELRALTETQCFAMLPPTEDELTFDSSLALREYWKDGGESFFEHVLRFDEPGNSGRHVWTPPTPRKSLTLDAMPRHALAETMLCHEQDPICGNETEPWRRRAYTFMKLFDRARGVESSGPEQTNPREACAAKAAKKKPIERFDAFRTCVASHAERHRMLPLGRFRAPRDGWLVVRGRRGHYQFCDEVRAYDLATGAAYVAKSCSGLALLPGGSVDGAKTNAGRQQSTQVGRVSVEAIREAAWMIALSGEAQARVIEQGFGWHVPTQIEIVRPEEQSYPGIGVGRYSTSSGQTTLEWSWFRGGRRVTSGKLRWPQDYDDSALEHAVRLLDIAEAGWIDGCAPVAAPTLPALGAAPNVSPLDAKASTVNATQNALLAELARVGSSRVCAAPPPPRGPR